MKRAYFSRLRGSQKIRQGLFWLFPIVLNIMLCLNLVPSPALMEKSPVLVIDGASISRFILSAIVLTLIYIILCAIFRKAYLAAIIITLPTFAISIWDFYKFFSLGTRVAAEDIPMVFSITDMWSPKGASSSGLYFSPLIFATGIFLFLYIRRLKIMHVESAVPQMKKRVGCGMLALWLMVSLSTNSLAYKIFVPQISAYEVMPSTGDAPVLSSIDCLIGSIYYDDYEDPRATKENIDAMLCGYSAQEGAATRPDIIVVMSESFFDLNRVNGVSLSEDIYKNFHKMQDFSGKHRIAVPGFGGGTACTEYEVLSGISNASLQNTRAPYGKMQPGTEAVAYPRYFSELGYETTYIHPFKNTFYNRDIAMPDMGFKTTIFQDDLTVPVRDYPRDMHISDETLTDQIIDVLKNNDEPNFIYATSMQNHTPYAELDENDPEIVQIADKTALTEAELAGMNAYAVGVRDSDAALGRLMDYAQNAEKPTAILFFGDHQPLLDGYKKLNKIENDNIYENLENLTTDFAYWANYEIPNTISTQAQSNSTISSYYLMDVFLTALGMPKTQYMAVLDDAIKYLPVYSGKQEITIGTKEQIERAKMLVDVLSYDRAMGAQFSAPNGY